MKLIVGLGNIGKEYEHTRHNVGFDTIDILAKNLNVTFSQEKSLKGMVAKVNIYQHKAILLKPTTYMNLSGEAVKACMNFYKIPVEDIIIISDDLDMVSGKIRYRENGSAGGHNGLKSIIQHLGTQNFKRIKIGIDRDKYIPVIDWVLTKFPKETEQEIKKSFEHIAKCLEKYIEEEDEKHLASSLTI